MHLVDEQHHLAVARFDLFQNRFQALLEFTAVFRAGDERPHVQRQQRLVGKRLRHLAIDDALREPLGNRRLADPGLADQNRIVLRAPRQDLDGAPDLGLAPDDRVELAAPRGVGDVGRVFRQRLVAVLGGVAVGGAALAHVGDGRSDTRGINTGFLQDPADGALGLDHREEQRVDGKKAVAERFRFAFGSLKYACELDVKLKLVGAASRHGGYRGNGLVQLSLQRIKVAAGAPDQASDGHVVVGQKPAKKMRRRDFLMVCRQRVVLRAQQRVANKGRKFVCLHGTLLRGRPRRHNDHDVSLGGNGRIPLPSAPSFRHFL